MNYPAIQNYINLPILSEEEESELVSRYRLQNDLKAAEKLILHHMRLVAKVARKYEGYGLPYEDLFQEGTIGLMKAVKSFDPSVGTRLFQHAYLWIKSYITDFVYKNWKIVRLPGGKPSRKLFWNRSTMTDGDGLLVQEDSIHAQHEDDVGAHEHWLKSPDPTPEEVLLTGEGNPVSEYLDRLDERRRYILESRYLLEEPKMLHELSKELGVSKERVRQLEVDGLKKLKQMLTEDGHSDILLSQC